MSSKTDNESMVDYLYDDFEEDTLKDKYLTFQISTENYGLEVKYVIEIITMQTITQVPEMPSFIKGIINLRGKVIPVMDVRARFKLREIEYDDRTCIIVVEFNSVFVGLIVDRVSEVIDIPGDQIDDPPKHGAFGNKGYIQGIGKIGETVKIILDVEKILYDEEMEIIGKK